MGIILGGFTIAPHLENFKLPDISFESPPKQLTFKVGEVLGHTSNVQYVIQEMYSASNGDFVVIAINGKYETTMYQTIELVIGKNVVLYNGAATLKIVDYGKNWMTVEQIS